MNRTRKTGFAKLVFVLLLCIGHHIDAQTPKETPVGGILKSDTTWDLSGHPYKVVDDVTVPSTVTLTVHPGVVVKFAGKYALNVEGVLRANGTTSSLIVFTSQQETPKTNDWKGISFSSTAGSTGLAYTRIEYAENGVSADGMTKLTVDHCELENNATGVRLSGGSQVTLTSNVLRWNTTGVGVTGQSVSTIRSNVVQWNTTGISVDESDVTIESNTISSNQDGISVIGETVAHAPTVVATRNTLTYNGRYNLYTNTRKEDLSTVTVDGKENWWGTTNAPAIVQSIHDRTDTPTAPAVDFSHFLDGPSGTPVAAEVKSGTIATYESWSDPSSRYLVSGPLDVSPSGRLTIQPGVRVEFLGNYGLTVHGLLDAQGTASSLVLFTSGQVPPARENWPGITLSSTAGSTSLSYARIEYAKTGFSADGVVNLTVDHCELENNTTGISLSGGSQATLTSNILHWNTTGVAIAGQSVSTIRANVVQWNTTGISVDESNATIEANTISSNQDGISIVGETTAHAPTVVATRNTLTFNSRFNLYANTRKEDLSAVTVDAKENWWGTTNAPAIAQAIHDRTDNPLAPVVDFSRFLDGPSGTPVAAEVKSGTIATYESWSDPSSRYLVSGPLDVSPSGRLTIQPGVRVEFLGNYGLTVHGLLDAQGTASSLVLFTSGQVPPARENWPGITLSSTAGSTSLSYARIEYAKTGFSADGVVNLTVDHCELENNTTGISLSGGSQATLTSNILHWNSTAVAIAGQSVSTIRANVVQWNTTGISVDESTATIESNTISSNQDGISVVGETLAHAPIVTATRNSLTYNTRYHLYTNTRKEDLSSITVKAVENWWGTTNAPAIAQAIHDRTDNPLAPVVDFSRFLDGPSGTPVAAEVRSGTIATQETWSDTTSRYLVSGPTVVSATATLTIKPGVRVEFLGNYGLTVHGLLDAQGTASSMVLFTSGQVPPAKGNWPGIALSSTAGSTVLSNARIDYAETGVLADGVTNLTVDHCELENNTTGIRLSGGSQATLTSNVFRWNTTGVHLLGQSLSSIRSNIVQWNTTGISVDESTATLQQNAISYNNDGLSACASNIATPPVLHAHDNFFTYNSRYNVYAYSLGCDLSSIRLDATRNWWGTPDVQSISSSICDFTDNNTYPAVDFCGFLNSQGGTPSPLTLTSGRIASDTTWLRSKSPYLLVGPIFVDEGTKLYLEGGVVIKMMYQLGHIDVSGVLVFLGAPGNEVVFTSERDDTFGGDTNGDGSATKPQPGDWMYVLLKNSITSLRDVNFRYGGNSTNGMLWVNGCSPEVKNCNFAFSSNVSINYTPEQNRVSFSSLENIQISSGGGVKIVDSPSRLANVKIKNFFVNATTGDGFYVQNLNARCVFEHMTVVAQNNGMTLVESGPTVRHSIFEGCGHYAIEERDFPSDPVLDRNCFHGNKNGHYYDHDTASVLNTPEPINSLNPPASNSANIVSDPLFAEGPSGLYYLSQITSGQTKDSPCIDHGRTTNLQDAIYGTHAN